MGYKRTSQTLCCLALRLLSLIVHPALLSLIVRERFRGRKASAALLPRLLQRRRLTPPLRSWPLPEKGKRRLTAEPKSMTKANAASASVAISMSQASAACIIESMLRERGFRLAFFERLIIASRRSLSFRPFNHTMCAS